MGIIDNFKKKLKEEKGARTIRNKKVKQAYYKALEKEAIKDAERKAKQKFNPVKKEENKTRFNPPTSQFSGLGTYTPKSQFSGLGTYTPKSQFSGLGKPKKKRSYWDV